MDSANASRKVTEEEVKEWYDCWHALKGEKAWRPFQAYPVFLDYLRVKRGEKLLDVGCGTGYLLKAAEERGLETYGTDISDEAVKIARKVAPHSQIVVGKGEGLRFPSDFF